MTTTFASLDDVGAAYYKIEQETKKNLFAEGDVVMSAIEQGFSIDETITHCAMIADCSARTVYRRYAVKRTFNQPHAVKSWEICAICADLVDYRSTDTALIADQQEQARRWLLKAESQELSTRQLRQALKGARVTDRIVLVDGKMAYVESAVAFPDGKTFIKLMFDTPLPLMAFTNVQVTIVQEVPKVEAAHV